MEVQLTRDQKAFIRQAIESGRIHREEDAVQEALSLWEERERRRLEILIAVGRAEASLALAEGRTVTTEAEVRAFRGRQAARDRAPESRTERLRSRLRSAYGKSIAGFRAKKPQGSKRKPAR